MTTNEAISIISSWIKEAQSSGDRYRVINLLIDYCNLVESLLD
jgi:hypothetical protein